jgi:hypothetical protein
VAKYLVCPSRLEEVHEGLVWIKQNTIVRRTIVKISNPATDETFFCEALPIDSTDRDYYEATKEHDLVIFMNGWYRKKLGGIPVNQQVELELKTTKNLYGSVKAAMDHPQSIIKITLLFALLSIVISVTGILMNWYQWSHPVRIETSAAVAPGVSPGVKP